MSSTGEARRTAFEALGGAASGLLIAALLRVTRFATALYRRRVIADLGEFDDRMLRDIGLTRGDLRDAVSGPIWQDPTSVLVVRAVEKRAARQLVRRQQAVAVAARPMPTPKGGTLATCD